MTAKHKVAKVPKTTLHARVRRGNLDDADRAREALLAAAGELFSERGLDGVTIRAVATLAGVSAMTPYRYFSNKAELLAGLWQSVIAEVYAKMKTAIGAASGGRNRQRASLDSFLAYWEDNPDHYRLVYMTEQTTRAGRRDGDEPKLAESPIYQDIVALVLEVTRDLAHEIGVDMTHAKFAGDVRFMMLMGYLNGQLINQRYPWSDRHRLRSAYIEQIILTVERCLRLGPVKAVGDADSAVPAATRRRARSA